MSSPASVNQRALKRLWLRWISANAAGELLGLGTVAGVGYLMIPAVETLANGFASIVTAVAMILLGLFEGLVVGLAQWLVLRWRFPRIGRGSWVGATMAGAAIAWMLGMPVIFLGIELASRAESPIVIGIVIALSLLAAGAVVGAIHGWQLLRNTPTAPPIVIPEAFSES